MLLWGKAWHQNPIKAVVHIQVKIHTFNSAWKVRNMLLRHRTVLLTVCCCFNGMWASVCWHYKVEFWGNSPDGFTQRRTEKTAEDSEPSRPRRHGNATAPTQHSLTVHLNPLWDTARFSLRSYVAMDKLSISTRQACKIQTCHGSENVRLHCKPRRRQSACAKRFCEWEISLTKTSQVFWRASAISTLFSSTLGALIWS